MKNFKFKINGNPYDTRLISLEGNIAEVEVNGTLYAVELEKAVTSSKTPKLIRPQSVQSNVHAPKVAAKTGSSKVLAPLPGTVSAIKVKEGAQVKKGDIILVLEAMKMENNIMAEKTGKVNLVKVKEGQAVLQGDLLIEIE